LLNVEVQTANKMGFKKEEEEEVEVVVLEKFTTQVIFAAECLECTL
jgi:hypothetical protein